MTNIELFSAVIKMRDELNDYVSHEDTYEPRTYIEMRRCFEATVSDFMRTVPETLNDDQ